MLFTTEIKAIHPESGELVTWQGPNVPGICFNDAQEYCNSNGLGYCKVTGILNCVENDGMRTEFVFYN